MNWQGLFQEHILDRGYDYYCEGVVDGLEQEGDVITASVCGTTDYEVQIILQDNMVVELECSCPYAEKGLNCKHMAAVLFEWEESRSEELCDHSVEPLSEAVDSIAALVGRAKEEEVKRFLTTILESDETLLLRFKNLISPKLSKVDMINYKNQIESVVRRHLGRDRFIHYFEVDAFISELSEFLYNDVQMMIESGNHLNAFELTNQVFISVGNVDMDDSDGGTGMLAQQCYEIWLGVLDQANMDTKRIMFEWFKGHLYGSVIDYMEEYIEKVLMERFQEEEYMLDKLSLTDQKVSEAEATADSWSRKYQVDKWALWHLELMKKLGSTWSELEAYGKKHWSSSGVRKYFIEEYIQRKECDAAIALLKEIRSWMQNIMVWYVITA